MGIELYPQSTSLVFWRRCRPLQFQLEPSGAKFAISFGSVLVCLRRGCGLWRRGWDTYDATVTTGLDEPLLDSLTSITWGQVKLAADLGCGTGRTGLWLRKRGVQAIHGVDLTQQMLDIAALSFKAGTRAIASW
jgi:hypothetical protein